MLVAVVPLIGTLVVVSPLLGVLGGQVTVVPLLGMLVVFVSEEIVGQFAVVKHYNDQHGLQI